MESGLSDGSYVDTFDELSGCEQIDIFNSNLRRELEEVPTVLLANLDSLHRVVERVKMWNGEMEELTKNLKCEELSRESLSQSCEEEAVLQKRLYGQQVCLHEHIKGLMSINISLYFHLENFHKKIDEIKALNESCVSLIDDVRLCRQEFSEKQDESQALYNKEESTSSDSSEENYQDQDFITESLMDNTITEDILIENDSFEADERIKTLEIRNECLNKEKENRILTSEDLSNPDNWKKIKFFLPGGVFQATELSYIIHSFKGALQKDDLSLSLANEDEFLGSLHGNCDVLSNVIRVEPAGLNEYIEDAPLRVSIPYAIMRNPHREVVIFCLDMENEVCRVLETQESLYEESKEEGIKCAEAFLPSLNCICVVVSKRKVERFEVNKRGVVIESKVDDRISMLIPAGAIMVTTVVQLTVNSIENSSLGDLKARLKTNVLDNIQTISPIVYITSDWKRKLLKSAILQIPIPFPHGHATLRNRIFSAAPPGPDKIDRRPKTALTHQVPNEPKSFVKLAWYNRNEGSWRIHNELQPTMNKNGDSLTIDLERINDQKIVAIRCNEDLNVERLQRALEIIEDSSEERSIQFLLAQLTEDPNNAILITGPSTKVERHQRLLKDQGYNPDTFSVSPECTVRERDWLTVTIRGNIKLDPEKEIAFPYNSQLPNRVKLYVQEKDKFAQKSKDHFQGFVSVLKVEDTSETEIWKTVINIPKFDQQINKFYQKDFNFIATDVISKDYLRFLSNEIGEDWKYLAYMLKLPEECVRRIASNFRQDTKSMAYECLMKWIKNTTVYSNKVEIMERAFKKLGRQDLLKDLSYRNRIN